MNKITLMAVGDTAPYVEPPGSIFEAAIKTLSLADIRFAQVERTFSTRGIQHELASSPHTMQDPHLITAYSLAEFDVVGLATNHCMDFGPLALIDTIKHFREKGIASIGTGSNIREARAPAIIEKKGVRVAFLGYCSVLLPQYWATDDRPGCAPARAHTYYSPYEYQPGTPARIFTIADKEDMEAMVEDIQKVRPSVDIVICSFHWGVHWVPRYIAEYQIEIGHAAIDAGCDLILGHHAHLLKGVEVYKGKPIIYSLGNFAMSRAPGALGFCVPEGRYTFSEVYDIPISPDYTYRHKDYYNHTVIAKATLNKNGQVELSFIPVFIEDGPRPTVLEPDDNRFTEIVRQLQWCSEPFGTNMVVEDRLLKLRFLTP